MGKGWDWIVWDALLTYSHVPKSGMYTLYSTGSAVILGGMDMCSLIE